VPRESNRSIEQGAEQLLQMGTIPSSYSEGAKKAWAKMEAQYGPEQGRRIFVQKALERGEGASVRELADSVYKTGAKLPSKKAVVKVELNRERAVPPTVHRKRIR
jgi:hypothetical protein